MPEKHHIVVDLVAFDGGIELRVDAPLYGDPPAPATPAGPTNGLWEYEVVEVFIAGTDTRYTEIEMAPSGHHLVLQLDGVRNPVATLLPLVFDVELTPSRWRGVARIDRSLLPPGPWRLNATSIHGSGHKRTYLSMVALPGSAPDFHQPDRFEPIG